MSSHMALVLGAPTTTASLAHTFLSPTHPWPALLAHSAHRPPSTVHPAPPPPQGVNRRTFFPPRHFASLAHSAPPVTPSPIRRRVIAFFKRRWAFFLLDFCYLVNLAAVAFVALVAWRQQPIHTTGPGTYQGGCTTLHIHSMSYTACTACTASDIRSMPAAQPHSWGSGGWGAGCGQCWAQGGSTAQSHPPDQGPTSCGGGGGDGGDSQGGGGGGDGSPSTHTSACLADTNTSGGSTLRQLSPATHAQLQAAMYALTEGPLAAGVCVGHMGVCVCGHFLATCELCTTVRVCLRGITRY